MDEESSSPNIEWKKKQGFETSEKNSRKTDIKKSIEYEAKRKNNLNKTTPVRPSDLPKGLKKIRKKIKEAYEEAKRLLKEHRNSLDKISDFLIEKETITGKEFMEILS